MKLPCSFQGQILLILLFEQSLATNDLAHWKSIIFDKIDGEIFVAGDQTYALVNSLQNFVESQEVCGTNGGKLIDFASYEVQNHLYTQKLVKPLESYCVWINIEEYLDKNMELIDAPGIIPLEFVDNFNKETFGFDCVKMCVASYKIEAYWARDKCFNKIPSLCVIPAIEVKTAPIEIRETTLLTTPERETTLLTTPEGETTLLTTPEGETTLLTTPEVLTTKKWKSSTIFFMVQNLQNFQFTSDPDWKGKFSTTSGCARVCQARQCATFTYCTNSKVCEIYLNRPPYRLKPATCNIWASREKLN